MYKHIGVIGAGSWGTALAIAAHKAGRKVTLWAREQSLTDLIHEFHENAVYLKDVPIPKDLHVTSDLKELEAADALLLVTPSHAAKAIAEKLHNYSFTEKPLVICSKGFDHDTGAFLSDFFESHFPQNPIAVLTGPNIAKEVALGLPAATTIASNHQDVREKLIQSLQSPMFRPYGTDDVKGAQIGGALKNIMAIACGITVGAKLGDNARAAVITRGLKEIRKFGAAFGCYDQTFMGLAGVGDLTLTCNSFQSRNMALGRGLGEGKTLHEVTKDSVFVNEGVLTTKTVYTLAQKLNLDMPITAAMYGILYENKPIGEAVKDLMLRPLSFDE